MIKLDFKTWKKKRWDLMGEHALQEMRKLGIKFGDTVLIECANNTYEGCFGNGEFIAAVIKRGVPVTSSDTILERVDYSYPVFNELYGKSYLAPLTLEELGSPVIPAYMRKREREMEKFTA